MSVDSVVAPECALPGSPLAAEKKGVDTCVHCGFCLQACPTYLALEDENDSPRGRILLMRSLLDGTLSPDDPDVQTHISRCLGCRGCETVCPSGVPYGHMLEATRATFAERRALPWVARVILRTFEHRWSLGAAMAAARLLRASRLPRLLARMPGQIGFAMAMLASTERPRKAASHRASGSGERGKVAVLEGCVMRGLFAEANRATEDLLTVNGFTVVGAPGQRCCGALHAHAGDAEGARRLARANIEAFERANAELICTNAAGCGAMMKDYSHLLAGDAEWAERAGRVSARVRDVSELLDDAGALRRCGDAATSELPHPAADRSPSEPAIRVTYDAPCHLVHAQRIDAAPLALLRAIPDIELVPLVDSDQCCGSAGIYNLIEPETSNAVLAAKLERIAETRAELVATGNPGCMMQIGAGLIRTGSKARAVHPVEIIAAMRRCGDGR